MQMCNVNFPCKDCTDRHVGCHSTCEPYLKIKKEHQTINEKIREQSSKESALTDVQIQGIRRMSARRHRRETR